MDEELPGNRQRAPRRSASLFERQPDGRLTGIYFEPPPGGWGSVMPLSHLITRSPYPVHAATHIPEGYRFDNATWIQAARTATLTYDGGPSNGSLDARHVTLLQALTEDPARPVTVEEPDEEALERHLLLQASHGNTLTPSSVACRGTTHACAARPAMPS